MVYHQKTTRVSAKEIIFQILLHGVVFIFYSFDKYKPQITVQQAAFFLNYVVAALLINYFLLPRFVYQKKYLQFFGSIVLILAAVIVVEEALLEPYYFPNTKRAEKFPGVFYCLLDVLPVIAMLSGFKFAWDALGKQKELDELKTAVKDSELQFLKSQINPHFLFNNLNNLYASALEQSPKTPEIILELSGVLRYMLYECRADEVPLTKEVEHLENFINLSEMQIEGRGRVHFVAKNIQPGYSIAPLILVVFVENAIKHSTASQTEDISIDVSLLLREDGVLEFRCTNSFHEVSNTDHLSTGIGLENVRKRLELLYPKAHQLHIKKSAQLYEVNLTIHLKSSSST
jgi:two-component system, LytTR family, sensor kinase